MLLKSTGWVEAASEEAAGAAAGAAEAEAGAAAGRIMGAKPAVGRSKWMFRSPSVTSSTDKPVSSMILARERNCLMSIIVVLLLYTFANAMQALCPPKPRDTERARSA